MANPLGILRALAYPAQEASGGIAGWFEGQLQGEQLRRQFEREDLENALRALQLKTAGGEHFLGQGDGTLLYQRPGGPIQTRPIPMGPVSPEWMLRHRGVGESLLYKYVQQEAAGDKGGAQKTLEQIRAAALAKATPTSTYTRERLGLIAQGAIQDPQVSRDAARTRLTEDEARDVRVAGAKAEAAAEGRERVTSNVLTPEGIELAAQTYVLTRQLPPLGMGGLTARSKILNRAAALATASGIALNDVPMRQVTFRAAQAELTRLQSQRGLVLAFANTADRNLDIASALSTQVSRTGTPVFDRWLLAGRRAVSGDPLVAQFETAVRVAINETARVTSGQTSGPSTDTARKEIEAMLNTAQTPQQFAGSVAVLKADMANRRAGYDEQIAAIQAVVRGLGTGSPSSASGPPAPTPPPPTQTPSAIPSPTAPETAPLPEATRPRTDVQRGRPLAKDSVIIRNGVATMTPKGEIPASGDTVLGSYEDYLADRLKLPPGVRIR